MSHAISRRTQRRPSPFLASLALSSVLAGAMSGTLAAQANQPPTRITRGAAHERAVVPVRAPLATASTVNEAEYNGTLAFADDVPSSATYCGTIENLGNRDHARFVLTQDTLLSASVAGAQPAPVTNPALFIMSEAGDYVAFNDDANGTLYPAIETALPAGTYYARVYSDVSTGDYAMTLTATPLTIPAVVLGQATTGTIAQAGGTTAFRVRVPSAGTMNLRVPNPGGLSLTAVLHTTLGVAHATITPTAQRPTPAFEVGVAGGDYVLNFSAAGTGTGSFTFDVSFTPNMPALTCGSTLQGSIDGSVVQVRLHEIVLPVATEVDIAVNAGGSSPMPDPIMLLLDRNLTLFMYSEIVGTNPYPRRKTYLPAGTYYVWVTSSRGTPPGTFAVSMSCAAPGPLANARIGSTNGTIVGTAGTAALAFDVSDPMPLNFGVAGFTITDPSLAVLDATGRTRRFADFAGVFSGNRLAPGNHVMLVSDYFGAAGTFGLELRAQLTFVQPTKGTLSLRDKFGNLLVLFATPSLLATPIAVPAPFTGRLALDLSSFIALPIVSVAAGGLSNYPGTFPDGAYFVQGVSLVPTLVAGAMTNVAN